MKSAQNCHTLIYISTLEVLIEKGSAAVSCELRIGQRQFVEQLNI